MASNTVTYTPSPIVKYLALSVLLVAAVALTYVQHVFPSWAGLTVISAYIPTVFYFAAHDLESNKPPNGLPSWTTLVVVSVASAVYGAVGAFVLMNGTITLMAVLAWALVVLTAIFHSIAEDQGASAPVNAEAWATAGLGIGIGLIAFFLANPTAGLSTWIATGVVIVGQYVHIQTDGNSISASPVTPPPTPAPPPS